MVPSPVQQRGQHQLQRQGVHGDVLYFGARRCLRSPEVDHCAMDWLDAPDYWLSRLLLQRTLALLYLVAFLVAVNQFRPLLGERGLLPAPRFLRAVPPRRAPSIFHLHYSDRFFLVVAWAGVVLSVSVIIGLADGGPLWLSMLVWFLLWALYQSIVNVGQIFYAFGWESLLLESGFLAIFLGSSSITPPWLVILMMRWLLFRVEFGAGLIKLRGDPCWRDLTCLYYHHETQPMPNPLSWFFHNLPRPLHKVEVAGNHFAQLVAPIGLAFPQPISDIAGVVIVVTQVYLVVSGNFSWLNWITIACAISAFDNGAIHSVLPIQVPSLAAPPLWYQAILVALALFVLYLSYWPARNLVSRRQLMNFSFNPFHLVGAYGAFGAITRIRYEVVVEGTSESELTPSTKWLEYEFKGKPGGLRRVPPQVAPYHLRLDWVMWFAAMSSPYEHSWFVPLLIKLLENDRKTLRLLGRNPFPTGPPAYVRAKLYRYRFTTFAEWQKTGQWWMRQLAGDYVPPVRLRPRDLKNLEDRG